MIMKSCSSDKRATLYTEYSCPVAFFCPFCLVSEVWLVSTADTLAPKGNWPLFAQIKPGTAQSLLFSSLNHLSSFLFILLLRFLCYTPSGKLPEPTALYFFNPSLLPFYVPKAFSLLRFLFFSLLPLSPLATPRLKTPLTTQSVE